MEESSIVAFYRVHIALTGFRCLLKCNVVPVFSALVVLLLLLLPMLLGFIRVVKAPPQGSETAL